jgi:hypothetical protein
MRVLLSAQHTSRDDGDFRVLLEKDSFTLDFTDWSITASFARTHVLKYAVGPRHPRLNTGGVSHLN